jgi:hypothetical protein
MSVELWKTIFDWATVVLIALTVVSGAGALITGDIISKQQAAKLRQFNTDLTDAKTALGKQQERAATADAKVAELEKDAANAKAAQQKVEIDLAKQKEKAADAEKALLELKARLADRNLTPQQRIDFTNAMKSWSGSEVDVIIWGDSAEVHIIADQLLDCLVNAGWHLHVGYSGGGGAVRGILIGVASDAEGPVANAFVATLSRTGMVVALWKFDELKPPVLIVNSSFTGKAPIRLFIGSKPPK